MRVQGQCRGSLQSAGRLVVGDRNGQRDQCRSGPRWLLEARSRGDIAGTGMVNGGRSLADAEFVPVQISAAATLSNPPGDIRVEIQRGVSTVKVLRLAREAASCAAWLRDWLK